MFSFRPHEIGVLHRTEGSIDNEGNYTQGECYWSYYKCRIERNQKAETIVLDDGTSYEYSYVVYLDLTTDDFICGESVRLYRDNLLIDTKVIRGFTKGQLDCRLWL